MPNDDELHVVFGTGPLGRSVIRELFTQTKPVRAVNRSGKADFPASVQVIAADVFIYEEAMRAAHGATVVYQCAQPAYHQWPEKFPRMQESILNAAEKVGAKLVVAENLYMYGEVEGPIHEGLPYAAATRKGRTRAQMAEALLDAHRKGNIRVTIGRGSDFFGPHVYSSNVGDRVFRAAVEGRKASVVGRLDVPHTYTFVNDFAKALVILGAHDQALGEVWHVPNAETVTTGEFIKLIYEDLGTEPRVGEMGQTMLKFGGVFIPAARETLEMLYGFEKPFVVANDKFVKAFGDHATPLRDAIRQTVEWFKGVGSRRKK